MPSLLAAPSGREHDDVLPLRVRTARTRCIRPATGGTARSHAVSVASDAPIERESTVTTMAGGRDERSAYPAFRERLDAVLRQRDPATLRAFLVAEGQWQQQQTDDEAAMWMMIAGSPTLNDMHDEAERWLASHGHEAEARVILGRRRLAGQEAGAARTRSAGRQHRHSPDTRRGARGGHGGRRGHGQRQPPKPR